MGSQWVSSWISGWILYYGDPAVLDLQLHPLHTLQQSIRGVGVGVGQLIALVLSLDGSQVGQPRAFQHHHYPLHHCLGRFTQRSLKQGAGPALLLSGPEIKVTPTHIARASSTVYPGKAQGPLSPYCCMGYMRGREPDINSPALLPSGLSHLHPGPQDQLQCAPEARHRARFPVCCSLCGARLVPLVSWSALSLAAGGNG